VVHSPDSVIKEIGESLPHAEDEDNDPLSHYLLTETHVEIGVDCYQTINLVYEVRCSLLLELRLKGENPKS